LPAWQLHMLFGFLETQEHKVINDLEYSVTILSSSEPNIESATVQKKLLPDVWFNFY